ncbi:MAG: hypothetical protein MPJ25_10530, partial [Pirellulales bacterium]|nr:hypothetical protein [Pirellulales bacterium]
MPNITDLLPNTLPADYATQQNDVDRTVDVPVQIVPDIQVGHVHVFTSTQTSRDDALDDFYVNGRPTTGTLFTVGDTAVITFNAGTTIETLLYTNSTSKSGATVASDWIDITEAVGAVNLDATHNASNVVITNTAGNDATINGATLSAAGVVTTGTQAFAGNKRFSGSTITVSNQLEVDGNTVLGTDNTAIIQLWGSVGVPTSAGTATATTNMLTVDGDGTVEIRNLPTSTGSGGGEVVILTATGQTVPDNGVAYVSLTEQYWNISGADQTNVVLTTDFTDTNTWARVGDGGGTVSYTHL